MSPLFSVRIGSFWMILKFSSDSERMKSSGVFVLVSVETSSSVVQLSKIRKKLTDLELGKQIIKRRFFPTSLVHT